MTQRPLLQLLRLAWREHRQLGAAILCGSLAALSSIALIATSAWLISTAALRPPVLTLTVGIGAVQLLAMARSGGRYLERLLTHSAGLRLLGLIRLQCYRLLQPRTPGGLATARSGDVLCRAVADVDELLELYVRVIPQFAVALVTVLVCSLLLALLLPPAGLLLGLGLSAAGLCFSAPGWGRGGSWSEAAAARGQLLAELVELIQAGPDLCAFGRSRAWGDRILGADARIAALERGGARVQGLGQAGGTLLGGLTTVGVLALGVLGLRSGRLPGAELAVLPLVSLAALEPLTALGEAAQALRRVCPAAERLAALGASPPPVLDPAAPAPLPARAAYALEAAEVRYPAALEPSLRGVDLVLEPGSRTALVGPSGAGKSTVANLLLRFVECCRGRAQLGPLPLSGYAQRELRSRVALVAQETHLFAASLGANLRLARPGASDRELLEALRGAGLGRLLEALPRGLETRLGEAGVGLSGGERQRLGLARALLARRPLLVLDEPTSQLDRATGQRVLADLVESAGGRTLLLITHELEELAGMDQVLQMARGEVVGVRRGADLGLAELAPPPA